jgi:hypothetical protein
MRLPCHLFGNLIVFPAILLRNRPQNCASRISGTSFALIIGKVFVARLTEELVSPIVTRQRPFEKEGGKLLFVVSFQFNLLGRGRAKSWFSDRL